MNNMIRRYTPQYSRYQTIYSLYFHRLDTSYFVWNSKSLKQKQRYFSGIIYEYHCILLIVIELFPHCPLFIQFSWPYERENQNLIITAEWAIHLGITLWDPLWDAISHKLMFVCLINWIYWALTHFSLHKWKTRSVYSWRIKAGP